MFNELIAAKLIVLNGTNPATDAGAIVAADRLLAGYAGKLPYGVAASSSACAPMIAIAAQLDCFHQDGARGRAAG